VLSDEYEIVFNAITIFKDLEMGIARLRAFVDLYVILKALNDEVDWEAFLLRRRDEEVLRIVVKVLDLLFELFQCRTEFSMLDAVIMRERKRLNLGPTEEYHALMASAPGAARNKVWASGLYECSRFRLLSWWILSYPFRLAVYQPPRYVAFIQGLERLKTPLRLRAKDRQMENGIRRPS
jgi:hypothetical protein